MKEELAEPFICLISFGVIALFILLIRGRKARVSRHPDKVIRRIKPITNPMPLRNGLAALQRGETMARGQDTRTGTASQTAKQSLKFNRFSLLINKV